MRHVHFFIFLFALFFLTMPFGGCESTDTFAVDTADGDAADSTEADDAGRDCLQSPVSCDGNEDCASCDGEDWECCEGLCMQQCVSTDGDLEKDIEYDCPATGKTCVSWQDCYLYCPTDEQQYLCTDGVCVYQGAADGDAELPGDNEPADETDAVPETETDADAVTEIETEADPDVILDQDDECYTGQPNRQPEMEYIAAQTVTAGHTLRFTITASDPDPCDTLTYECVQCPGDAAIDTTATPPEFVWETTATDTGSHTATIRVTDSGDPALSVSNTVQITVSPDTTNNPPVIPVIDDRELLAGDRLEFAFTVSDPEGDPLTLTPVDLPAWASMILGSDNRVLVVADAAPLSNPAQATLTFSLADNHDNSVDGSIDVSIHPRSQAKNCGNALRLHPEDRYYGSTDDRSPNATPRPPCIEYPATGPDMFFVVQQNANTGLFVQVDALNSRYDPAVSVWEGGCSVCITGHDIHTLDESETLLLNPLAADQNPTDVILVVSSFDNDTAGAFMVVASPDDRRVTGGGLCTACGGQYDCGYQANCVEFYSGSVLLEQSCGLNCENVDDCPKGYQCQEHIISGTNLEIKQCAPAYSTRHEALTCSAFAELGNACTDTNGSSDEGECGADDALEVDDADCSTFRIDGNDQSLCTVKCGSNDQCPEGYSCQQWQILSGYGFCLAQ